MLNQMQNWLGEEEARLQKVGRPPFFKQVEQDGVRRDELVSALLTRYQVSHFFNDILGRTLERLEEEGVPNNDPLTATLRENLDEELGQSDNPYGEEVHDDARARLIGALGIDYSAWSGKLGTFQNPGQLDSNPERFVHGMKALTEGPVIPLYSAMAYWEWRVSRSGEGDYKLFLDAFERLFPELKRETYSNTDALWHLYSHSVHDDDHAQAFLRALSTTKNVDPIISGFHSASALWDRFWNLQTTQP